MKKRIAGGIMAAAMTLSCLTAMPFATSAAEIKVECESGTLTGTGGVKTEVKGYSGEGYMYLEDNADVISIPVTVEKAGMYELKICYQNNFGSDKIQNIVVNDVDAGQMSFPETAEWAILNFGAIKLNAGENTIAIKGSWGWTNFDYITLTEAQLGDIKATQTNTCDPDSIDSAKQLMSYLSSIYGEHILSGQQEIYKYGPHDTEYEFNYIKEKTGKLPAIRGFDLGNSCNPITSCFGEDQTSDRMIEWAEKGGIIESSFHLNVPTDFASYTMGDNLSFNQTTYSQNTDFSPAKAYTEGTKENAFYTQALDKVAEKFLALQEKGISILWRPLHEAEGGGGEASSWFWWGREGSKTYRELYIYTYKYLTETKGCHNLIWEFNSYAFPTSENWYPGDEYVDIIGYDKYNCTDWSSGSKVVSHNDSAISSTFYTIMNKYNSAKMIAMMENDSFSTVDNLTSEKAGWLYFLTWYDGGTAADGDMPNFLSDPTFNTEKDLIDMYTSDYCITLDELPKLSDIEFDPDATNATENTQPTEPEEGHARISADGKGNFNIDLPEASETICLVVDLGDATSANGGLGVSIALDGTYYWANIQWKADKSGINEVNLVDQLFNVTTTVDNETVVITDDAILDQIKKILPTLKSFQGQVWWAGAGETELDKTTVAITDAYIKASGETDPEESDTTEPSETETLKKGDVNGDDNVNIMDIILLNKAIYGKATLTPEKEKAADVDGDGKPTASDSLMLMKVIVKLITLE